MPLIAPLVPTLGARVGQFFALLEEVPVTGAWGAGKATVWAEIFDQLAADTTVVMRYGTGNAWLENQPAAVSRKLGKGTITYLGAVLDPALMASVARQWVAADAVLALQFRSRDELFQAVFVDPVTELRAAKLRRESTLLVELCVAVGIRGQSSGYVCGCSRCDCRISSESDRCGNSSCETRRFDTTRC